MTLDLGAEYGEPRQYIYTARFLESFPLRSLLLSAMILLQTAVTHGTAAIYHIHFLFLIFILHVTLTCSAHFSVHSDDILTNRSQKHLQNQAFCCQ